MDDADLKALLTADSPPAADPRFVVTVMARIEQRRFRRELAMILGLGACAILLLALLAPSLEIIWKGAPQASNLLVALALMTVTLAAPHLFPARD
ncbi:MAG: hypothetical protein ABI608_02405 [Rhizomicrobium sp.]